MRTRRTLPYVVALLLGAAVALLAACGDGTKGGLPAGAAGALESQLEDVRQAVDAGRCEDLDGQLRQVDADIDRLPASVDERLRDRLRDAADRLRGVAVEECNGNVTTTQTQTETEPTQTQTQTQTETAPQTQTEPSRTTTAPQQTTTAPTTTAPTTTTVAPPPPPPPGGGTPPEIGQ